MNTTDTWVANGDRCAHCARSRLRRFKAHAYDAAPGTWVDIVECVDCAFAWQFPLGRSTQESAGIFDKAYNAAGDKQGTYFDPDRRAQVAQLELDYVRTLAIPGKRMLDVGGGDGAFAVAAAGGGWTVTAVDPALDPQRLMAPGLTAIRGTARELPPGALFDVVTMWDVVEHLEDPAGVLAELLERVPVGGWLVIETGNHNCAERVRSGVRHWIYQLDHRWYFSPDSLGSLLEATGWQVTSHAARVLRPGWRGAEQYSGPTLRSLVGNLLRSPMAATRHVAAFGELRRAAHWPQAGLEIFCLAAQRAR